MAQVLGYVSVRSIKKSPRSVLSFVADCRSEYFVSKRDHNIYWNPNTAYQNKQ